MPGLKQASRPKFSLSSHAQSAPGRAPRTFPTLARGVEPTAADIAEARAQAEAWIRAPDRTSAKNTRRSNAELPDWSPQTLARQLDRELHTFLPGVVAKRRAHLAEGMRTKKRP